MVWQQPSPHISHSRAIRCLDDMLGDRIRLHQGAENLGHGWGINRSADTARAVWDPEYFFIVNPDVVWTEPVLDSSPAFLREGPGQVHCWPETVGFAAPDHRGGDCRLQ